MILLKLILVLLFIVSSVSEECTCAKVLCGGCLAGCPREYCPGGSKNWCAEGPNFSQDDPCGFKALQKSSSPSMAPTFQPTPTLPPSTGLSQVSSDSTGFHSRWNFTQSPIGEWIDLTIDSTGTYLAAVMDFASIYKSSDGMFILLKLQYY